MHRVYGAYEVQGACNLWGLGLALPQRLSLGYWPHLLQSLNIAFAVIVFHEVPIQIYIYIHRYIDR